MEIIKKVLLIFAKIGIFLLTWFVTLLVVAIRAPKSADGVLSTAGTLAVLIIPIVAACISISPKLWALLRHGRNKQANHTVAETVLSPPSQPATNACDITAPLATDQDGNVLIQTSDDWTKFYAQYTAVHIIYTKVVGVTFQNSDGTNRQEILSRCNSWDEISLEPFTYHGDPAYAVWTRHGQIGNLSADIADMISSVYGEYVTLAAIKNITGGRGGKYYGCNLILTVYARNS